METVNLKTAITFRLVLHGKPAAFTTRAFRGERLQTRTVPEPREEMPYRVHEIAIDSNTMPWLDLQPTVTVRVLWSNVLSVQPEEEDPSAATRV
jgi:hypothetical protein